MVSKLSQIPKWDNRNKSRSKMAASSKANPIDMDYDIAAKTATKLSFPVPSQSQADLFCKLNCQEFRVDYSQRHLHEIRPGKYRLRFASNYQTVLYFLSEIVKPVVYKPAVKYVYTDAATSISYNTPPVSASYTHTAQTDEHEIEPEYVSTLRT